MRAINDGGPAFPETRWSDTVHQEVQWTGMTLRDWFAGRAITGSAPVGSMQEDECAMLATAAYAMADAMLKARA
jgi:hypothetical protein